MATACIKFVETLSDYIINEIIDEFDGLNKEEVEDKFVELCNDKDIQEKLEFSGKFRQGASVQKKIDEAIAKIMAELDAAPEMKLGDESDSISVENEEDDEDEDDEDGKPMPSAKMAALLKPSAEKEIDKKPAPSIRARAPRQQKEKGPSAAERRLAEHIKSCNFEIVKPIDVTLINRNKKSADALVKTINKYRGEILEETPAEIAVKAKEAPKKPMTVKETIMNSACLKSNHLVVKYTFKDGNGFSHSYTASYGAANESRRPSTKTETPDYTKMEKELIKAFNEYAKDSKIIDPFSDLKLLKTEYIYDLKKMEIKGSEEDGSEIVDYLNNVVLNEYAIGYSIVESPEYIYRKRDYNHLFDLIRVDNTYNGTVNKEVVWNVYKHRYPIIYHEKFNAELEENWKLSLQALDAFAKKNPTYYDKDVVATWKAILSSKQCYNVICKGYPATLMFEKHMKDLIQNIETIKLLMGPLFYISPMFSPYAIYCKDMVTTKTKKGKKDEEPVTKDLKLTSTFVTSLIRHVTLENDAVLNYDDCIWIEGLQHLDNFDLEKIPDSHDLHSFRILVTPNIVKKQTDDKK